MPHFTLPSGNKIFYERYGDSGPAVILLHGLASSSRIWSQQIHALKTHFQIYMVDFPGHGKSDRCDSYSFETFADVIALWMDGCGISHASLIALSLGCTVALIVAGRYPEKVDALVLEGPIGGYHPWWNPFGWPDQLVFTLLPITLQLSIFLFGRHAIAHWLNTFGLKKKRNFKALEALQQQMDFQAVRQLLWQSIFPPYIDSLKKIMAPTLLIRGCNDPMPQRFVRYIQTHLQNAVLIEVPETRHIVAMDNPHEFNRLVINFLNKIPE